MKVPSATVACYLWLETIDFLEKIRCSFFLRAHLLISIPISIFMRQKGFVVPSYTHAPRNGVWKSLCLVKWDMIITPLEALQLCRF
jgi:hypothetical protein